MRIIKEAYQHLSAYIMAQMVDDQDEPLLRWLDLWYNQIMDPAQADTLDFPAVFLEFSSQGIEGNGEWEQHVEMRIGVYLAIVSYADTYHGAAGQTPALNYLEMLAKLHDRLQGYRHPSIGTLNRVAFEPVQTATNLIIYRQDYVSTRMEIGPAELRRARVVAEDNELELVRGDVPPAAPANPFYNIPM